MSQESRRDFLSWLCFKAPLTTAFGILGVFSCESDSQEGKSLYLPPNNAGYHNGQPSTSGNSRPNSQPNAAGSKPHEQDSSPVSQVKISVLDDLKKRVDNAQIEITYSEDGDPYVKSISGIGSECLYFTVNGEQFLGDEIHAANVFIDPENDIVEWYCNGELLDI